MLFDGRLDLIDAHVEPLEDLLLLLDLLGIAVSVFEHAVDFLGGRGDGGVAEHGFTKGLVHGVVAEEGRRGGRTVAQALASTGKDGQLDRLEGGLGKGVA